MLNLRGERERQVSAVLLVTYAALMLAMIVIELAMLSARDEPYNVTTDFAQKADLSYVMSLFLAYLVIGAVGLIGTIGLIRTYGQGTGLVHDVARFMAITYFFCSYWLWSAMWIVQHKLTLLADTPTNPPEWVIQVFSASDAFWSIASWGAIGPSLLMFVALGMILLRGARPICRWSGYGFLALAASQFLSLAYVGVRGFGLADVGRMSFSFLNDMFFTFGRIAVYLAAASSLFTEKGILLRSHRPRHEVHS
jgi:hypothetical protein